MKLYDSKSSNKKELEKKNVSIYLCGPTVYNYVHIGNIRSLITIDILVRYLKETNNKVKYALNITDVDDKIIDRAKLEHKTEKEISSFYEKAYFDLFKQLNVEKQTYNPRVTENIKGIIGYVDRLIKKNKAYVGEDGDVYFDINSVKDVYGSLSKQKIDMLLKDVRKENNSKYKHNPLDFVLWKKTDKGVNWKSPWNDHGRPGWHTECSYFINNIFGDDGVTIHSGGVDLKFPHHENELAQNYALTGKEMADMWVHVGHVNVNNVKMSKSLNNFVLAKDILSKYDGNVVRWYFLQTQYENPMNYSDELMVQNKNELEKFIKSINYTIIWLKVNGVSYTYKKTKLDKTFVKEMDNDMNFPNVVAHLYEVNKKIGLDLRNKKYKTVVSQLSTLLTEFYTLGFNFKTVDTKNALISQWKKANESKDYAKVDQARKALREKNII